MICQLFDAMCSHSVHIFEPFHVCLASKFAKSVDTTPKIFFPYIFNMGIKKTQNLIPISTPLKKLQKAYTKKCWDLLYTELKGKNVHNLYSFMLKTLLCRNFITLFQRIWNQYQILHLLTPTSKCCEFFWGGFIIVFFKKEKSYFQMWIRINKFPILIQTSKVLKSFHPNCLDLYFISDRENADWKNIWHFLLVLLRSTPPFHRHYIFILCYLFYVHLHEKSSNHFIPVKIVVLFIISSTHYA